MLGRQHVDQPSVVADRLKEKGTNPRKQAEGMPPGIRREELLRKARQVDDAAHVSRHPDTTDSRST
jgi:hypothetical protein